MVICCFMLNSEYSITPRLWLCLPAPPPLPHSPPHFPRSSTPSDGKKFGVASWGSPPTALRPHSDGKILGYDNSPGLDLSRRWPPLATSGFASVSCPLPPRSPGPGPCSYPPAPQVFYTSPCTRWSPSTPPVSQSRGSAHGRTIAATPLPTHSPISDTSCSRPLSHAHDGPRRRRVKLASQWRRVGVMPRVPRIRVASPLSRRPLAVTMISRDSRVLV